MDGINYQKNLTSNSKNFKISCKYKRGWKIFQPLLLWKNYFRNRYKITIFKLFLKPIKPGILRTKNQVILEPILIKEHWAAR